MDVKQLTLIIQELYKQQQATNLQLQLLIQKGILPDIDYLNFINSHLNLNPSKESPAQNEENPPKNSDDEMYNIPFAPTEGAFNFEYHLDSRGRIENIAYSEIDKGYTAIDFKFNANDNRYYKFENTFNQNMPDSIKKITFAPYNLDKIPDDYIYPETTFYMFCFNATGLEEFIVTDGWTFGNNITSIEILFMDCFNLTNCNAINYWDTSKCKKTTGIFLGCDSLEEVDLSHWDLSATEDCTCFISQNAKLKKIKIKGNTSNCKNFDRAFAYNSNLETIEAPYIDMSSCTNCKDMFADCSQLKGVKIKNPPADFATSAGLQPNQYTVVD